VAAQLFGEARVLGVALDLRPSDRLLASVPAQHIYGLLVGILAPLANGASLVCGNPLLAEEVAALVRASGASVLVSVPAHLRALASLGPGDLAGVRSIVSSSAPLDTATATQLARFQAKVIELFGSTETGGIATREAPDDRWRPLPGVVVTAAPDGTMLLDSPFLDPDGPRPYAAADRIALTEGGAFRHLGRADGVLKIAGRRITLDEIEGHLRKVAGVIDASVTAVPAEGGRGHEVWALVVAPSLDVETIRRGLGDWLDPVMAPRRLRLVSEIPREATGKVPLQRWRTLFGQPEDTRDFAVQSRRDVESGNTLCREVTLTVPADLPYFTGHFDANPVLPGVVILNDLVLAQCHGAWPELSALRALSRVKFHLPVRPNDALTLRLTRERGQPEVTFEVRANGRPCSSGTLAFATST
jgi:acyl-coenzyme A synthetase/AMP-(fatty) acid ligase/3-hydroxymyristoyl/3-hydroxydecanoyl-(acyl carrier protein) dehydratase